MTSTLPCPRCQGPVDVSCFNGTGLRCACGKTVVRTAPEAKPAAHAELRALLSILRENRVSSYSANGVLIALSPDSWREEAPAAKAEAIPPDEMCTCGHPVHDHTQAGCVIGCDVETCGRAEA